MHLLDYTVSQKLSWWEQRFLLECVCTWGRETSGNKTSCDRNMYNWIGNAGQGVSHSHQEGSFLLNNQDILIQYGEQSGRQAGDSSEIGFFK